MNMKTFAVKICRWFEASFEVPVANATRKTESKRMNLANILTGIASTRLNGHRRHHRHHPRHSRCVYLEFVHAQARRVFVAGSFNDWRPAVTPMIPMGCGWWVKGLVLPPGRYEYRLVVDGQSIPDPNAAELAPNPDGGGNSVLVVPSETGATQPRQASPHPVHECSFPLWGEPASSNCPATPKNDSCASPEEEKLATAA